MDRRQKTETKKRPTSPPLEFLTPPALSASGKGQAAYLRRYRERNLRGVIKAAEQRLEAAGVNRDAWHGLFSASLTQRPVPEKAPGLIYSREEMQARLGGEPKQPFEGVWFAAEVAARADAALRLSLKDLARVEWWDSWVAVFADAMPGDTEAQCVLKIARERHQVGARMANERKRQSYQARNRGIVRRFRQYEHEELARLEAEGTARAVAIKKVASDLNLTPERVRRILRTNSTLR